MCENGDQYLARRRFHELVESGLLPRIEDADGRLNYPRLLDALIDRYLDQDDALRMAEISRAHETHQLLT